LRNQGRALIGNRLTLAGAIIYLLEWVGIIGFNTGNVPAAQGAKAADVVAQYTQHGTGVELLAGWLSLVLLGRILFVAGIRDGLRKSGAETLLADFAFGAMAVSVIIEIGAFAVAGGAVQAVSKGADQSTIVGIDAAANWLNMVIVAPFGVSVLAASFAMLRSQLFPAWLCWLGIAAGVVLAVDGAIMGPAFGAGGAFFQVVQTLSFAVLAAWVWMIATGVILLRAAVRKPPMGEGV
jgi:hypothetical protein